MPKRNSRKCVFNKKYIMPYFEQEFKSKCGFEIKISDRKKLDYKFCPYCGRKIRIKEDKENA